MRFWAAAPAPASEAPTKPPDKATEPVATMALMLWRDSASTVRLPAAVRLEFLT